ncbi:hypothetical protein M758_9G108900 [Ceratodon purpureus]|nr:hypothetical protein M758_9G108900 [Ceratodon purpureus]
MAICIDGKDIADHWIPDHEHHLDEPLGITGRYVIDKVYVHATVIHDPAKIRRLSEARTCKRISLERQAALDWQQDSDDELDEGEVIHHLKQVGEASFPEIFSPNDHTTRSHAISVESPRSPSFSARAAGQCPSSLRRHSIKISMLRNDRNESYGMYLITHTNLQTLFPNVTGHGSWCKWGYEPKISWSRMRQKCAVVWQMQIDFVDLLSSQKPESASQLGKRRRTVDQFLRVSSRCEGESSRVNLRTDKRSKGVRYRPERRAWVAEMKPPGSRNKASFGDFKSETEAARAVDAAFYYYGKLDKLNFANTLQILATKPAPPALDKKDKLRFVKQQAKWLSSLAFNLPSSPTSCSSSARPGTSSAISSLPLETPESSRGSTAEVFRNYPSLSDIASLLSCGGCDLIDDGVSQPRLSWTHPDPLGSSVASEVQTTASDFTASDQTNIMNEFQEGHKSIFGWNVEGNMAGYSMDMAITQRLELPVIPPSFGGWTTSSSVHSCDFQMDTLFLPPPTPIFDQVMSPYCDFQGD